MSGGSVPMRVNALEHLVWFLAGRESQRDRHYFAVKAVVSVAIMVALFMPQELEHLALPIALIANMLWIWVDP